MLQISEWYVVRHNIFWDQYTNTHVAIMCLSDANKIEYNKGPNIKITFKTRCGICTNQTMDLTGCTIAINDIWFNREAIKVCLKKKSADDKYVYESAYIDVIWFNDAKVLNRTYAAQPQPEPQTTAQTTAETVGFDWDEDLSND